MDAEVWYPIDTAPSRIVVMTKTVHANGGETDKLPRKLVAGVWWNEDMSERAEHVLTHWRPLTDPEAIAIGHKEGQADWWPCGCVRGRWRRTVASHAIKMNPPEIQVCGVCGVTQREATRGI